MKNVKRPDDRIQIFYRAVAEIPRGKVMTYGGVAKRAGISSRLAGRWLHQNPDPREVPCHRVVFSSGRLAASFAFGGLTGQAERLQAEGVTVIGNKVDLAKYLFRAV